MSAGRPICAESGQAETVGAAWHWSSIATPESCWVGIFPDLAKAKTAEAALEQALIARYGTLGHVATPFLLRSDNGLVFTSRSYTALVRSYGLRQEFITPHCPEQNGMVERVFGH
jgi:transposase InsO family protein